ncbi:hypothetical protein DFH29DRAFT_804300 [Suillus ampliporus]|nr:hypothetical protein DFH29DRAFT_804300 [Suillus ampliporus]
MVLHCQTLSEQQTAFSFLIMITYTQLAIMCQSTALTATSKESKPSILKIYNNHVAKLKSPPSERTFYRWHSIGCKCIALAASGSLYILVLVVGLEIRKQICTCGGQVFVELGLMLRWPETSLTPDLVTTHIIPSIAWIRSGMPLSLQNIFCTSFLELVGVEATLDCTDLSITDQFFGAFKQNDYSLPGRDMGAWISCTSAITQPMLIVSREVKVSDGVCPAIDRLLPAIPWTPHVSVIQTSFDRKHSDNLCFPAETNRMQNIIWTEHERRKAEAGYDVQDLDDLCSKLANLYIDGCCKVDSDYIRIPMNALQNGELDLRNSDDSLMVFVCSSLPDRIRKNLTSTLLAYFDGKDVLVERELDEDFQDQDLDECDADFSLDMVVENVLKCPFQCLHFSLWNRYVTKGDGAPAQVHPHNMAREAVGRTNSTQRLPYPSRDILKHWCLYNNLLVSFEELFQWIEQVVSEFSQIKECLPNEYEVLVELCQDLPGGETSSVSPFLSLVINLNVSTIAHHDKFDKDLCLVLPLGEFSGGALAMFEQGLVVELRSGDFAIFRSAETTHFNL